MEHFLQMDSCLSDVESQYLRAFERQSRTGSLVRKWLQDPLETGFGLA